MCGWQPGAAASGSSGRLASFTSRAAESIRTPATPRSNQNRSTPSCSARTTEPDGTPGEWYLHLFTPEQPDLNWDHPDVRAEHEGVLRFWFDRGVAGVRIDSAALLVKDASLPELPLASFTSRAA